MLVLVKMFSEVIMRLKIPLTGTISKYHPELAKYGGSSGISGDLNDPVRPVPVNLGNVSWKLVSIDLETDTAEIEVTPSDNISEPDLGAEGKQKKDKDGNLLYKSRQATEQEKVSFLQYAKNLVEGHTKDELYQISKCPRLKRPTGNNKLGGK